MCLKRVDKSYRNVKDKNFGIGYKIFRRNSAGKPKCNHTNSWHEYGKWLEAKKVRTKDSEWGTETGVYTSGFHIFISEADAKDYIDYLRTQHCENNTEAYVVMRVRYKDVMYIGKNYTGQWANRLGNCVIAGQMFIEKENQ